MKDRMYFLKVSGSVKDEKQKEFEQTVQFIINHLSSDCLGGNLAHDVVSSDLYHFYSLWSSEESVKRFRKSNEFKILKSAFKTLGSYSDTVWGKKSDLTLFEISHLDINPAIE